MIFWCLNNKTISNYKKSTYGSFMCMLFDAYEKTIELDMSKKNLETAKSTVQSDFIHDDILRNARKRQKEINQILNGEAKDNHDVTKETTNDYEREEFY